MKKKTLSKNKMEIWGGIECTINRVGDQYYNQLEYQGHYSRKEDLQLLGQLGLRKLRYPLLWERHQPEKSVINWDGMEEKLLFLKDEGIDVIAGLVHHGSGPCDVHILDDSFAEGLASYAEQVALKFPWINFYTPVNEPLTTARFCGLYGLWFPHKSDETSFLRILVNECKATILAMQAIRKINPEAKLVFTEDLGKVHSTALLKYQADFENERRWLSVDLICGKVNARHVLYGHLVKHGITETELNFFREHALEPDILGFNHYITSERYLDEKLSSYPKRLHGGNHLHNYVDVEAVRVADVQLDGPEKLLSEAWERYGLPIAVTEAHLYSGREDQLRWLKKIWEAAVALDQRGVNILGVTVWSLFGAFGWDQLLTAPKGNYENGVYDIRSGTPRKTALADLVRCLARGNTYDHPVMCGQGWWETEKRIIYPQVPAHIVNNQRYTCAPVLIVGGNGTLGSAFARVCNIRNIHFIAPERGELDIVSRNQIESAIIKYKPWAIINASGYSQVDAAELEYQSCFLSNTTGPGYLADFCSQYQIKLVTFSSDLVFDGWKQSAYVESDPVNPLNVYGASKAAAEESVLKRNEKALIIRTSTFFSPWDHNNFLSKTISSMQKGKPVKAADDVFISPVYIPDLVNTTLDLLIDDVSGLWHLVNDGNLSWFDLAKDVAKRAGIRADLLSPAPVADLGLQAKRPAFSALKSNRGILMPTLDYALWRFFNEKQAS